VLLRLVCFLQVLNLGRIARKSSGPNGKNGRRRERWKSKKFPEWKDWQEKEHATLICSVRTDQMLLFKREIVDHERLKVLNTTKQSS
jgi:hypothetical protein